MEMYAQDSKTRKSKTNVCAHIFVILDEKQYGKEVQNTMKSNKEKRQKSLRRVGSFLLAAMLMFSSTATAFAFDKDTVLQESTKIFTKQTTKQLTDEGMVLLENEQKDAETGEGSGVPVLPLSKGSVVSVFGVGQNKWSTGSFYDGLDENFIDIMEGLEASEDLEINEDLRNWYNDVTKDEAIPEEILQQAVEHSDVALIVFYRKNGEGSEGKATQGGYYLTDDELAMVDSVNQTFDKTIVVFNTGYTVDMQWVKDKHIDASIWAGLPGNEGGNALADILTGAVNPSGKLVDTYAKSWEDYPSSSHWADSDGTDEEGNPIVYYTDDIYVGYRYFETFDVPVTYEFGYGLSYTDFTWSDYKLSSDGSGTMTATVQVENTGDVAGKDVVELYFSYPTDNDSMDGVDVPAIQLLGYGKTDLLEPGESQEVSISFDYSDLALYNETASAYYLYAGVYRIKFGHSVRDITGEKTFICNATQATENVGHYMVPQEPIDVLEGTGAEETFEAEFGNVERRFDEDADSTNADALCTEETAVPVDAESMEENTKGYSLNEVASGKISLDTFVDDLTLVELAAMCSGCPDVENFGKPTLNGEPVMEVNTLTDRQVTGRTAGITERDIYGMTMADRQETIGYYNESSWGDGVGSCGFQVYPSSTVIASSWNQELVEQYGESIGRECKDGGIDFFLAPSMNIHRNPMGGRNSEYFSEDPVISGYSGAAVVRGVQSNGIGATLKHFACNNQETNRQQVNEFVSERALREIYLKGYEIATKDAKPWGIMTSYNKINGAYSPENYDMLQKIVRNEWGFDGVFMTDWGHTADINRSFAAGNNLWMASISNFDAFYQDILDGILPLDIVKQNVKETLNIVLRSQYYADIEPEEPEEPEEEEVDKTLLNKVIDYAEEQQQAEDYNDVIEDVKAGFEKALQEAKVVQADPKASEEDVLKSWTNLVKWIHALGMRSGDKTLLLQVITAAGTYNLDNYVDAGKEEFQEALQEAQKVYEDEFAGQDTVDIATDRLMNAILELRLKANKSNLDALLKSAKKIDLTQYTRSTANALQKAIQEAEAVMENDQLSEDDQPIVKAVEEELKQAMDNLERKNSGHSNSSGKNSSSSSSTGNTYGSSGTVVVGALQTALGQAEVVSDTTVDFTLKRGASYCFKMNVVNGNNRTPNFTVGNGDVLKTQFVAKIGNDFYFRVYAIGIPGQSTGVYTTLPGQNAQKHCTVTIV